MNLVGSCLCCEGTQLLENWSDFVPPSRTFLACSSAWSDIRYRSVKCPMFDSSRRHKILVSLHASRPYFWRPSSKESDPVQKTIQQDCLAVSRPSKSLVESVGWNPALSIPQRENQTKLEREDWSRLHRIEQGKTHTFKLSFAKAANASFCYANI